MLGIEQSFAHRISDPPYCKVVMVITDKRVALKCDERKCFQYQTGSMKGKIPE